MTVITFLTEYYDWYLWLGLFNFLACWADNENSIPFDELLIMIIREIFLWPIGIFNTLLNLRNLGSIYQPTYNKNSPEYKLDMLRLAEVWEQEVLRLNEKEIEASNSNNSNEMKRYMYRASVFKVCAEAIRNKSE